MSVLYNTVMHARIPELFYNSIYNYTRLYRFKDVLVPQTL